MKKTEKKSADEKKRRKNSGKISLKTSRLKWWLQETPPTNLCPVRSVCDVSLRYSCWNCADIDLLPQHMHAEILPTGTPPTNQYPVYSTVCFSHESRSHRDLPQQTYAQYIILYRMFLLHIQAKILPTRISSHKPVSNTFSKGCFSSMSRLKWCLRLTPTNSCPLRSLCFSYTSRLKSCWQGTTPTNPCSVCCTRCFSYTSRLKHFLGDVSLIIQVEMVPVGNYSN